MMRSRLLAIGTLLAVFGSVLGQDAPAQRKQLSPDDYKNWELLGRVSVSNDGKWVLANVSKVEGDPYVFIRSSDGPEKWTQETATQAVFSDDSAFVVYSLVVPRDKAEDLRKQKKRIENRMGVFNLSTGVTAVFDSVASWRLIKGTTKLAVLRYPAENAGKAGGDFEVFDLKTGDTVPFGNVKEYEIHKDKGLVALHTVSPTDNEGIVVVNCADMRTTTIAWAKLHFGAMEWAEESDTLAFMSGEAKDGKEGDWVTLAAARGFLKGEKEQAVFDPNLMKGFPEGVRIVESSSLRVSKDGTSVAFGTMPWKDKDKGGERKEDAPGVEIWNTKDVDVVPLQTKTAGQDRNRATQWVWTFADAAFRSYAEPELDNVRLSPDHSVAIAFDARPYASPVKKGGLEYVDVIAIDTKTGAKTILMQKAVANAGGLDAASLTLSPEGGYAAWFDGKDWELADLRKGVTVNMTQGLGVRFDDREDDHVTPRPPAGGNIVWLKDDKALIVHSDYDAFLWKPGGGKTVRLTEGEKEKVRYRLLDAGFHENGVALGDPLYFAVFDTKTKESGIARWTQDKEASLLFADSARVAWAARSKNTDRVLFVHQTYEKTPTAYLTNLEFSAVKPVVSTNRQQDEYFWGKTILVNYKALGKDLQGVLIYPADYQEGKKYPMVTYVYERMSDELNRYRAPSNTNPYSEQHYSQAGYFVFCPDIAYQDRQPGKSAVKCIETGLKAVFALNVGVDPTKVGLTGHSWGGYETVYVATQSKMFAAYVAGAPLTELLSMYNSFYWNSGQSNQVIFEVSQGRMGVPWWEDMKSYIENSPLFHAGDITAPMLVEVGTVDGAVDWHQGQYLYNTLRRMGKNMVMLVYANENHGLAVPANQKDYASRARHFFDVYLKGATPERWVDKGVPFIDLADELKSKTTEKKDGGEK